MDKIDRVFSEEFEQVKAFAFDQHVADVFSDMVKRSIPGYELILKGIALYAMKYAQPDTRVYDLGCSLGAVSLTVHSAVPDRALEIIAVDSSEPMVQGARERIAAAGLSQRIAVHQQNIHDLSLSDASMVVSNFTLQFMPREARLPVVQKIYQGLNPGGVFVLSEKVLSSTFIRDHYHGYKKINGYSDREIRQKRQALENMLVPDEISDWQQRLQHAGFEHVHLWFQCFNFVSLVCIKHAA